MFKSLKSRIIVPIIGVMALLIAVIVVYVSITTASLVYSAEDVRMDAATQSIRAYLTALEQQTFIAATAIGGSGELIRRMDNDDRLGVWQYLVDQKARWGGITSVIVTDPYGNAYARSVLRDVYGDWVGGGPAVAAGLRGESATLYMPTPTAPLVMTSSAPIMDGDRMVGVVAVNFDIATPGFVHRIRDTFDVDVTVFAGYTSIASTLMHPDTGEPAVGTPARDDIVEAVINRGGTLSIQLDVFGRLPYSAFYFPLFGADGRTPTGMFFIGIPQADAIATINTQRLYVALIGVAGLFVAAAFLYLLINTSMKPLDTIRLTVKEVAAGNMAVNIDRSKSLPREIDLLTTDVSSLVDVIRNITDDLSNVHTQYVNVGDIRHQIDASKYQRSFKEMVTLVNNLLTSVTEDIEDMVNTMNYVSDGDFDKKIDFARWAGDWKFIPEAFSSLTGNLKGINGKINAMTGAVSKGDLSFQIDTDEFQGDWRVLMTGLNSIAKSVAEPLGMIEVGMKELHEGNFDLNNVGQKIADAGFRPDPSYYKGAFKNIAVSFGSTISEVGSYIAEIEQVLAKIAKGDLTNKIERHYVGSFFAIKDSVNTINQTLHKTMSGISTAAEQVLLGANQISSNAADLASGAQQQSSAVEELNASIDMISQQTRQNADNALTANDLSNKSTVNAGEGADAMKQMVNAMEQIKESSNNIGKIVQTVQDIAFQTNLLALNASVEAARAGEHGRGFAVVAEEVRTLAGRSQDAATETTTLVQDTITRVGTGSTIAETTAESLNAIVKSAGEVLEVIGSISTASKEQAEAIGQISGGIAQISNVTQTNTAVSEETAAASQELNAQAETLQELVSYFKL